MPPSYVIKNPLLLVLEQANEEQRIIGEKLQKLLDYISHEQAQYDTLSSYQDDYTQKIKQQQHCSATEVNRYRVFYAQLNTALDNQKEKTVLAESQLVNLRQSLSIQQHKISVLTELIKKKEEKIAFDEEKKLQKLVDELSARQSTLANNTLFS